MQPFFRHLSVLALAGAATFAPVAHAAFPERPVTIVVAFAPGTGSDVIARLVAKGMAPVLGQPVVVDNKAGAGGMVGTEAVARAAADGYTLALGTTSTMLTTPLLNAAAKYRVDKDFVPVSGLGTLPFVIVTANTDAAPKTLAQLVERLKARPGNFASSGMGTITHLGTEMLLARIGVTNAVHLPYKGSAPALTDVASGQVLFATDTMAGALALIRSGKLRPLAVTSAQRLATLPDVPTTRESGYPEVQPQGWLALFAPANTPPALVHTLGQAALNALASAEMRESLKAQELQPLALPPAELADMLRQDGAAWTDFLRKSNIKLD